MPVQDQNERREGAQQRFPSQKVNFQKVLHIFTQLRTRILEYLVFHICLLLCVTTGSAKDWKESSNHPKTKATRKTASRDIGPADVLLKEKKTPYGCQIRQSEYLNLR